MCFEECHGGQTLYLESLGATRRVAAICVLGRESVGAISLVKWRGEHAGMAWKGAKRRGKPLTNLWPFGVREAVGASCLVACNQDGQTVMAVEAADLILARSRIREA